MPPRKKQPRARPDQAPAGQAPRRPPINWTEVRDEYVTGDDTFESIAERYGVSPKTVEQHADRKHRDNAGKTWGEMRSEFRDDVSEKFTDQAAKAYATKRRLIADKAADVALKALKKIDTIIDGGEVEPRDLINAAKLATAIKIEVTGDPNAPDGGAPIPITARLDNLSLEELRKLAEA